MYVDDGTVSSSLSSVRAFERSNSIRSAARQQSPEVIMTKFSLNAILYCKLGLCRPSWSLITIVGTMLFLNESLRCSLSLQNKSFDTEAFMFIAQVKDLNIEEGGAFTVSSADELLAAVN